MKLIGENSGRTLISYQSSSMGVGASQQVLPTGDLDIGTSTAIKSGQPSFAQGQGLYIGPDANGNTVLSIGSDAQGLTWDGEILNVIGTLQALAAIISGSVTIGVGGDIASGETAFATNTPGFWLGTSAGGNAQFSLDDSNGNYLRFDGTSGTNVITMSSPNGVINLLTSLQTDDAGLGTTAAWGTVGQQPASIAGYNLTGIVQPALPATASGTQILTQINGGAPFWADQNDLSNNAGGYATGGAATNLTTSFQDIGTPVVFPNPGKQVSIQAWISGDFQATGTITVAPNFVANLGISTDGGATYTFSSNDAGLTGATVANNIPMAIVLTLNNVTPTGDIWIKVRAKVLSGTTTGSFNLVNAFIIGQVCPFGNTSLGGGALTANVPATKTASCNASYPATTCAAIRTITAAPNGGTAPYTHAWTITAHTGTGGSIVGGSTSITVSVSDTETGTTGGANFTTTYKDTITDAALGTANGSCVVTSTFTLAYPAVVVSIAVGGGQQCFAATGNSCAALGTATATVTGGDGTVSTYAWTVTAGSVTIVSGSTSQTANLSQTGTVPSTLSSTVKCVATDGHSNSGNNSAAVNMRYKKTPT